jgi:hypothetical protein
MTRLCLDVRRFARLARHGSRNATQHVDVRSPAASVLRRAYPRAGSLTPFLITGATFFVLLAGVNLATPLCAV